MLTSQELPIIKTIPKKSFKIKYKWIRLSENTWQVLNKKSGKDIKVDLTLYKTKETIFNFLNFTIG